MHLDELPEFLTVEEATAVLCIGRTSAYLLAHQWRHSGGRSGLLVQRLGKLLRVPRSEIEGMALMPGDARRRPSRSIGGLRPTCWWWSSTWRSPSCCT